MCLTRLKTVKLIDRIQFVTLISFASLQLVLGSVSYAQDNDSPSVLPSIISLVLTDDSQDCSSAPRVSAGTSLTSQAQIDALEGTTTISGDLVIAPSSTSLDFSALRYLAEITGKFELADNTVQTSLVGFDCLETVDEDFNVSSNDNLTTLDGFPLLNAIGGNLIISNNGLLTSITGLNILESTGIAGTSTVSSNETLDCGDPTPNFNPIDVSTGNLFNCGSSPGFQIQLVNPDGMPLALGGAFENAARFWENVITGDLSDVDKRAGQAICNGLAGGIPLAIDDLLIFVDVREIDGPFGTIIQTGPCGLRNDGTFLPFAGRMIVDAEDFVLLSNQGSLDAVIRHEMGHVLGIGTLWSLFGLIQDALPDGQPNLSLPQPKFVGSNAVREYNALGGSGDFVPVENGFKNGVSNGAGLGSVNSHWAQTALDVELMTFRIEVSNPQLSRVTIGSLEDLGYTVDYSQADDFSLPPP